jgi:hypothetical protein
MNDTMNDNYEMNGKVFTMPSNPFPPIEIKTKEEIDENRELYRKAYNSSD